MTINENVQAMAKQFSKENKIGFNKLMAFLESLPTQKASRKPGAGRKASCQSLQLREQLNNWFSANQGKGQVFTVKQLAMQFGATPVDTNNAINWLAKRGSVGYKVKCVGHAEKPKHVRGKPASLFTVE